MFNTLEITIPVLNEEVTLEIQIKKIICYINSLETDKKISVVISDNGSTDNTEAISKKLINEFKGQVQYIKVGQRGVGLALKTAWSQSKADVVGYMDLDLATDIKHVKQMIAAFDDNDCDLVYGSRLHKDSLVEGRSFKREITSRIFNQVVRGYLGIKFSDGMCGFKFLKREHVGPLIKLGARSDGWFFCTELLTVAEWQGQSLHELPVHWTDDPNSKVNIKNLTKEYLLAMQALKNKFRVIR
jgi:glycosyltransferase involved in cell wall biosynthesis